MHLTHTRRMVTAALTGELDDVATEEDPVFGLRIPVHVEGVPEEVLRPRQTWKDPSEYDQQAEKLTGMFRENFRKFAQNVSESVRNAGP